MIPIVLNFKQRPSLLVIIAILVILIVEISMQTRLASAKIYQEEYAGAIKLTSTRTKRPEKLTASIKIDRLCGQLIFLTEYSTGVSTTGIRPCGGGKPYIFKVFPRDNVPYFQFRDVTIETTNQKFCTEKYGCINQYITYFQNYVGLESCNVCGISMAPPTWTQAPLTPYTPTPIPPTRTLWPTPESPTPSPTFAPGEVTPTLNLFEVLYGTATPTTTAAISAQPTPSETPTASITRPVTTITPSEPFYRRIGPIGFILLALLVLSIPLVFVLRDILRDR